MRAHIHHSHNKTAILAVFVMLLSAQSIKAEPPVHLTPGDILRGAWGAVKGVLSPHNTPVDRQVACSHELETCWQSKGLNKSNITEVFDACWQATQECPETCKKQYFAERSKGAFAPKVDDQILFGTPSCIPGLDDQLHPEKANKTAPPD